MLKIAKSLFRFDYLSPYDLDACRERFTSDYRQELRETGQYPTESYTGWITFMYERKKGGIVVDSDWGKLSFAYRITLEQNELGTVLHCKHNPFSITALFLPALLAAVSFIGFLSGIVEFVLTMKLVSLAGAAALFVATAAFIALCAPLEVCARNAVHRLVYQLVGGQLIHET